MSAILSLDIIDASTLDSSFSPPQRGILVVLSNKACDFSPQARKILGPLVDLFPNVAKIGQFKGHVRSVLDWISPPSSPFARIFVVGTDPDPKQEELVPPEVDFMRLGGFVMGKIQGLENVTILLDPPTALPDFPQRSADFVTGLHLRAYKFDRYKTQKKDKNIEDPQEEEDAPKGVTLALQEPEKLNIILPYHQAVAEGIVLARDLVNEPPNVLTPKAFVQQIQTLADIGVEVEILDQHQLEDIGMRSLLAVGQGSVQGSYVALLRWRGASSPRPVAFIGKGVCFDSGGISIKPAANMEDMKGDMGGAACVCGLIYTLAKRRAKVDAIGIIGLVENMPDGAAQRPGDIVTSLSGQTIEVINTDAEGRMVLADLLTYAQNRFHPDVMIDLATLTGAVLVALGQEYAGLFSDDASLVEQLQTASAQTWEKVWRLPLCPTFDKLIDSKFADMKNSGGRYAGSSTAAHFLKRFVRQVPWAHLDVAGTAMASPKEEINHSWGSGWGIRLLNRWVANRYES